MADYIHESRLRIAIVQKTVSTSQSSNYWYNSTMKYPSPDLIVVGGGLAGCEAAFQAASRGKFVWLYEMRPDAQTGAHVTGDLGELVCSNSLGSILPDRASGLLKREIRNLGSLLLKCAEKTALPAGEALAVDRTGFSRLITQTLENHPNIRIIREEVTLIPDTLCVIASGPLTSAALSAALQELTGHDHLFFYDAIAPIVSRQSINMDIAFRASRFGRGEADRGDYINCPMTKNQYDGFVDELVHAERISLREFERNLEIGVKAGLQTFFESCLPVEIIAMRGHEALAYGPMRPIGLKDPRTGMHPHAVVQLRQDNLADDLYNMVGFQTNLVFSEQKRVFRLIPGLENVEFIRLGQMHRNTFLYSPDLLMPTLQSKQNPNLFFAGQITGVEGYVGNIATGLLAGINAARFLENEPLWVLPETTMLGALCHYITHAAPFDFQPMKANMGLLPPLEEVVEKGRLGRRMRAALLSKRAENDLNQFMEDFVS